MSEVDPDPFDPADGRERATLGGRDEPRDGDPTAGGTRGRVGRTPGIAADEPDDDGPPLRPGGGSVTPDAQLPPVADPGSDA